MLTSALIVFWSSLCLLVLCYILYPILIALWALVFPRRIESKEHTPTLTLLIPAHNEEKVIRKKLEESLSLDWEKDKLEILVISDASDDATDEIVKQHADKGVRLLRLPKRRGKMGALISGAESASGEILVFTDANTTIEKGALRRLIAPLSDPAVGCVAGEQIIKGKEGSSAGEGLYWRYESFIKRAESGSGNVCAADGSLYALRRELFCKKNPPWLVMDDLLISLWAVREGARITYCPQARAYEAGTHALSLEFKRKARILAGSIGSMRLLGRLFFRPIALKLICHKLLRWASPFLMLLLLSANIYLQTTSPPPPWRGYEIALFCQVIFYALAGIGLAIELSPLSQGRLTYFPLYFMLTNLAQLWGFVGLLTGRYKPYWVKLR